MHNHTVFAAHRSNPVHDVWISSFLIVGPENDCVPFCRQLGPNLATCDSKVFNFLRASRCLPGTYNKNLHHSLPLQLRERDVLQFECCTRLTAVWRNFAYFARLLDGDGFYYSLPAQTNR